MIDIFDEMSQEQSRPARKNKRKRKAKNFLRTGIVLMVVAAFVALVLTLAIPYAKEAIFPSPAKDYTGLGEKEVVVTIPNGATGAAIGDVLLQADVVASQEAFVDAFNDNPRANSIQHGAYTLKTHMSAANAVAALLDPASRAEFVITIPEGTSTADVYEKISNVFGVSLEDVQAAASDTSAIGLPQEAEGKIEGWIAPLTYTFLPDTSLTDVLAKMVSSRVEELKAADIPSDQWKRTITLASIAEEEVNKTDDYGKAARVLLNRLDKEKWKSGLLQVDTTVAYGLNKNAVSLTTEDLKVDTPYNSYLHEGLPPTPISNPGINVIKAVLNPPEGDWLYWVTINYDTGETRFSSSYEEHKKNVQLLNEWCEKNNCGQ